MESVPTELKDEIAEHFSCPLMDSLNSINTENDIMRSLKEMNHVPPKLIKLDINGVVSKTGDTELYYVPIAESIQQIITDPTFAASRMLDKHPGPRMLYNARDGSIGQSGHLLVKI